VADVVETWLVRDDLPPGITLADLSAVLDDGERRRADGLLHSADRRRFVVAHAAFRLIVARCLDVPSAQLRWEIGAHGKPGVGGASRGLEVNLSHSGALSLVAVSRSRRVGVDIQHVTRNLDVLAMASRYFTAAEAEFVRSGADAAQRAGRFARLWARKEAMTKAAGGRLIRHGMAVPVLGDGPVVVSFPEGEASGAYRVADLAVPHGFCGAVALSGTANFRVAAHDWLWGDARWPKSTATPELVDGTVTGTPGS
jgi:4'-phosphopantetheinyl transferase